MPLPTRPASHIDWTDGNALKQTEPTSGKKLLGWTKSERPPFQYMNFLFYNVDLWIKWAEDSLDDHETRLAAAEGTIITLGSAASVSASNTGHTYLTGTTVQTQLNQTDDFLEDLANAITQGKGADIVGYIMGAPANWSPSIDHVGDALDQLALRVNTLENLSNIGEYVFASFNDYVEAATTNTGLTDNANTNPRGLKFNDLKYIEGEEIINCTRIAPTGNYDSNGLPEYEITSPRRDPRVRLYGTWQNYGDRNGARAVSLGIADESNYILVTGIYDSIALHVAVLSNQADDIDVLVDGVDTGTNISARGSDAISTRDGTQSASMISDATLKNLGMGLHTTKFTIAATDSDQQFNLFGIRLVGNARYQLGGKAWIEKNETTAYAISSPSAPTVGNKGGRVLRYIDPADLTLKYGVNNATVIETSASSIGAAAGTISVSSAAGFQAGNIVLLTDGPNNSELLRVTSVNLGLNTLTFATNTQNSYTSATVAVWGRTGTSVTHANEEVYKDLTPFGWGEYGLWAGGYDMGVAWAGTGAFAISGYASDGAHEVAASNHVVTGYSNQVAGGITPAATNQALRISFIGTGIDLCLNAGTISATMRYILDGVELSPPGFTNAKTKWYKVASDLHEGSHVLQIENDGGATPEANLIRVKTYRTKRATLSGVTDGDILGDKFQTGDPLFIFSKAGSSQTRLSVSRGVIAQHVGNFCKYIDGTGGSGNWLQGASYPSHSTSGNAIDKNYISSDRTNAKIQRWFYGTGIEIEASADTDRGISQIKIDGSNATTGNFPSANFHSPSGSGFNATSGQWDGYAAAQAVDRFGISNLTKTWHLLEIVVTGTKNGSSSGYFFVGQMFYIHGNDMDTAPRTGWQACATDLSGAIRDVRRLDSSAELEYAEQRISSRNGASSAPTFSSSGTVLNEMVVGAVETKPGEHLKINHSITLNNGGAGAKTHYVDIIVDGVSVTGGEGLDLGSYYDISAASNVMTLVKELVLPVAPGFHDVKLIIGLQAGTHTAVQTRRSLIVEPVIAIRRAS